jgi:hypothetical protein
MARKPAALARELLRNFPKGRRSKSRRRRRAGDSGETDGALVTAAVAELPVKDGDVDELESAGESLDELDTSLDEVEDGAVVASAGGEGVRAPTKRSRTDEFDDVDEDDGDDWDDPDDDQDDDPDDPDEPDDDDDPDEPEDDDLDDLDDEDDDWDDDEASAEPVAGDDLSEGRDAA